MLSTKVKKARNIYNNNNNNKSHAMHVMIMTSKTIKIYIDIGERDLFHFRGIE